MSFQRARSGYAVRVDGMLLRDSRFVIHASVEYGDNLSEAKRARLVPMAQLELLLAIEGEEAKGRRLGADFVHVWVAGDEPLYRFFSGRAKRLPAKSAAPTPARPLGRGAQAEA